MKTRFFIIYAAFFLLLSAAACGTVLCSAHHVSLPQHTTEINRLLIQLSDEWENYIDTERPPSLAANFDYAVIDREGKLLFATRRGISETLPPQQVTMTSSVMLKRTAKLSADSLYIIPMMKLCRRITGKRP